MISAPRTNPEPMPGPAHLARLSRHSVIQHRVVVDPGRIPDRWQSVDVAALRQRLGRPGSARWTISAVLAGAPVAGKAAGPRSRPDLDAARATATAAIAAYAVTAACIPIGRGHARRRRILARDLFVVVGREPATTSGPGSANDNAPAPRGDRRRLRALMREAVLLAMLAACLAGAFYSGRIHAAQNVIVVPPPTSARNVVT